MAPKKQQKEKKDKKDTGSGKKSKGNNRKAENREHENMLQRIRWEGGDTALRNRRPIAIAIFVD